jgi:hypothetical protein
LLLSRFSSGSGAAALFILFVTALLVAGTASAATVVLNFDRQPNGQLPEDPENGTPIASGTQINDLFKYMGVTLDFEPGELTHYCASGVQRGTNPVPGGANEYLELTNEVYSITAQWPGGDDSTQVISPCPDRQGERNLSNFASGVGFIRATFDRPVVGVCLTTWKPENGGNETAKAFIEAFDTNGVKTTVREDDPCITGDAIASVRFSGDGVYANFDDMVITYDPDLIDFDLDPFGYLIDGTPETGPEDISFAYSIVGVELGSTDLPTGACRDDSLNAVFARVYPSDPPLEPEPAVGGFAQSAPNNASPHDSGPDGIHEDEGWIEASFERGVDGPICIDGFTAAASSGVLQMRAFDSSGDLLDSGTRNLAASVVETLCLTNEDTRCVRFTGTQGTGERVLLDNLRVEGLPEPGSTAMAVASLLALGSLRRLRLVRP